MKLYREALDKSRILSGAQVETTVDTSISVGGVRIGMKTNASLKVRGRGEKTVMAAIQRPGRGI